MLSGSKHRYSGGRDVDGGAGLRISADAGFSLRGRKSAESGKGNLLAFFERFGYRAHEGLQRFRCLPFADASAGGNHGDHLVFGHWFLSLNVVYRSTLHQKKYEDTRVSQQKHGSKSRKSQKNQGISDPGQR